MAKQITNPSFRDLRVGVTFVIRGRRKAGKPYDFMSVWKSMTGLDEIDQNHKLFEPIQAAYRYEADYILKLGTVPEPS